MIISRLSRPSGTIQSVMEAILTAMRRHLKNTFIPHEGNEHRPHLLRASGALALTAILLIAFGFSISRGLFFNQGARFTAAVLPAVLVSLANDDRAEEGLGQLTTNAVLEDAARMKAEHMAEHEYFAHVSPDGLDPWYWFYRAGYEFVDAGENLAVNFTDSDDVNQAWLDSPGHRANIMNGKFTEIGIAAVKGEYKGKKTIYVVQLFGTPMAQAPAAVAFVPPPVVATVSPEPVITPTPIPAPVEEIQPEPEPEPVTVLIKEETSARVEGDVVAAEPTPEVTNPNIEGATVSFWDSAAARPRATVSWVYLIVSLLVSFVLLCMVFMQVHHTHRRSILYGVALLALICILSYLNWLLLSADLVIT